MTNTGIIYSATDCTAVPDHERRKENELPLKANCKPLDIYRFNKGLIDGN